MSLFCCYCLMSNQNNNAPIANAETNATIALGPQAMVDAHTVGIKLRNFAGQTFPMLPVTQVDGTLVCVAHLETAMRQGLPIGYRSRR